MSARSVVLLVSLVWAALLLGQLGSAHAAPDLGPQDRAQVVAGAAPAVRSGPNPNDRSTGVLAGGVTTALGALEITTRFGQPIELEPHGGGFVGDLALHNAGAKPLAIQQLQFRPTTDTPEPAADPDLLVKAGEGAPGPFTLAPGATRKVTVVWTPSKMTRLKQIYAQVVVQPDSAAAPMQLVSVHAARETVFPLVTDHPLGWLLLLPLLGAVGAALLGLRATAGGKVDPRIRLLGLGVTFAQLVVAAYALATFDPELTRVVGNDGLQLVDRLVVSRTAGIEMALGVDGLGVVLVTAVAVASFLAIVVMPGANEARLPSEAESRAVPLVLLVSASAMAFFTVGDLVLVVLFGALLAVNAARLVAAEPTAQARAVARRLGSTWALGLALVAVAATILRAHSSAVFLVDGSLAAHVSSIAELARQSLVGRGALPRIETKEAYVLLVAAAVLLSPLAPFGGALVAALAPRRGLVSDAGGAPGGPFAGGAISLMLAGALGPGGMYLLLRVVVPVLPEAVRWAGPATATVGALLFLGSVIAGSVAPALERRAGLLAGAQSGAVLVGIGSLTQEGIAAGYLLTVAPAIALLFLSGFGLQQGSRGGRLVAGFGVVMAAALCGPGAWGALLAATGAFASAPVASLLAWVAVVLSAGVGAFGVCRSFARPVAGKRVARWTAGETVPVVAALLVAFALTAWPAALVAPFTGVLRDSVDRLDPPGPDQIAVR